MSTRPQHSGALVIVPGIGMSHRYSARLRAMLARTHHVVSLDLPGFAGRRRAAPRMSVPDYAAAIARALDRQQICRATIIGHSMGSQFAVELARVRPSLVERLVLAAPVVDPARRTARQQSLDLVRDLVVESPSSAALVTGDFLRTGPRYFFTELRAMLDYRIEAGISEVACPVLVLRGENDPIARRGWCHDLAASARDGRVIEIAGAGHVLQHTATRAVATAIAEFHAAGPRADGAAKRAR
ncbi:alpha/beta fold hydrolase [Herbiconiux daphne]|uniref:Alpha/beta hydrolase n=1 Tax=Herbiconiux daphne TaxID=2970914 RepID=A0ABT2H3H4_9MICO|nr:alpha/beta hydrolase [Herbiconiux daphne]MCS5734457.1 alpha/beta hydrolase [Herbiconiux daphne]